MRLKLFTFLWINLSSCGAELSSFRSHRVTVLLTFLCLLLLLLKCLTSCLQRKLFRYTLSLLVRIYEIECEMEEVFKRMMETETFPYKLSHRKNFPFWYFFLMKFFNFINVSYGKYEYRECAERELIKTFWNLRLEACFCCKRKFFWWNVEV